MMRSSLAVSLAGVAARAALAALLLGGCGPLSGARPADPGSGATDQTNAVVVRVVDGDTFVAAMDGADVSVRLIGIDTPETKKPNTPVECYGPEAAARLRELLPERSAVRLEGDDEARDAYGRLLAYAHRPDGMFVNLTLVAEGFAAPLRIEPNVAHAKPLGEAADRARRDRRGLWGTCAGPHAAAP